MLNSHVLRTPIAEETHGFNLSSKRPEQSSARRSHHSNVTIAAMTSASPAQDRKGNNVQRNRVSHCSTRCPTKTLSNSHLSWDIRNRRNYRL